MYMILWESTSNQQNTYMLKYKQIIYFSKIKNRLKQNNFSKKKEKEEWIIYNRRLRKINDNLLYMNCLSQI